MQSLTCSLWYQFPGNHDVEVQTHHFHILGFPFRLQLEQFQNVVAKNWICLMPWKGWESHESWAKNETQHRIKEPPKKFGLIRFIHMLPSNWSINSSKANRKRRLTWRKWKWQGCTSDSKKTLFLVAGYDKPIDKRCTLYFHPKVKERKAWEKQNIKIEHRNSLEVHWFSKGQSQNIWDLFSGRLDRLFSANSLELITQERRSYDLNRERKWQDAQALEPHSSRISNMASYGCIGNCTCPVSDFKGMQQCRFHLLENQRSQERTSCPICPILTFENTVLILNITQEWCMFMSLNILPSVFCCSSRVVAPPITSHCHLGWFNPSWRIWQHMHATCLRTSFNLSRYDYQGLCNVLLQEPWSTDRPGCWNGHQAFWQSCQSFRWWKKESPSNLCWESGSWR